MAAIAHLVRVTIEKSEHMFWAKTDERPGLSIAMSSLEDVEVMLPAAIEYLFAERGDGEVIAVPFAPDNPMDRTFAVVPKQAMAELLSA